MIKFLITTNPNADVGTAQGGLSTTLDFYDITSDAIGRGYFGTDTGESTPLVLDDFVRWEPSVESIFSIAKELHVRSSYSETSLDISSIKLESGTLSIAQNTTGLDLVNFWTSEGAIDVKMPHTLTDGNRAVEFTNLAGLSYDESYTVFSRTSNDADVYLKFSFVFTFKIPNDPRTFRGKIDPVVKITNNT